MEQSVSHILDQYFDSSPEIWEPRTTTERLFKTVMLNEGEILIIPRGVPHKPIADEEVWLLLFEPTTTKHTGDLQTPLTQTQQQNI